MDSKITIGIFMLLLASGFIFISYDKADDGVKLMSEDDYEEIEYDLTEEDIREMEEHFKEGIKNQLPIEQQIEELKRVEIKLYGKEISDYDAIRNKQ